VTPTETVLLASAVALLWLEVIEPIGRAALAALKRGLSRIP
jgi:hypothetical protein